ncbi:MAG: hypothetical protein ACYC0P_07440 [Thiobacillus sp.]
MRTPETDHSAGQNLTAPTEDAQLAHAIALEHIHHVLLTDAQRGLEDIAAGRIEDASDALTRIQANRERARSTVSSVQMPQNQPRSD